MIPGRIRRRGWSLLELLVVMTAATALLTISAGLVFQMLKIGGAERSRVVVAATLERLGHDLRADAHAATKLGDLAPGSLLLALPEGRTVEEQYDARQRAAAPSHERIPNPKFRIPNSFVVELAAGSERIEIHDRIEDEKIAAFGLAAPDRIIRKNKHVASIQRGVHNRCMLRDFVAVFDQPGHQQVA